MSLTSAPEMKDVTPSQVVLFLGLALILATTVVVLALSGLDPAVILSGIATSVVTLGGAFAWKTARDVTSSLKQVNQGVEQVKDLSNGRFTEVLDDNRALHQQVAALSLLVNPVIPKESE